MSKRVRKTPPTESGRKRSRTEEANKNANRETSDQSGKIYSLVEIL